MASVCRRRSGPWFAGGATASVISAVSCSTEVATSRGYTLELFGALSLQRLRIAITTAAVVPSTKTLTPLLPTPRHLPVVHIRRDAPTRSPRRRPPCCRTTRNRYISSKYSRDPASFTIRSFSQLDARALVAGSRPTNGLALRGNVGWVG